MANYDVQLEKVANVLQLLPRKLNEHNVRVLGNLNHFETFEEDGLDGSSSSGKRLSLSGSIVVLDLDFTSTNQIEKASVSLSQETASDSAFSMMSPINHPSEHLLNALKEPRLDVFANMLSFLSRCDRFSTKNVDCFRSLDLVSESIHWYVNETKSREFGKLVMNPPQRLGLGFLYKEVYTGPCYAYLDIIAGSRTEYCLRNFTKVDEWIDKSNAQWRTDLPVPDYEARAELVLTLDPPIVISADLAKELNAIVSNNSPKIEERKRTASLQIRRHPRFVTKDVKSDEFDIIVGNVLPFQLVEVNQIPVTGPAQIATVLGRLRQFGWLSTLTDSVLDGPDHVWSNEAVDINIADALELVDQPVHRKNIPLAISLRSVDENDVSIDVSWVVPNTLMSIRLPGNGGHPEISFSKSMPSKLNLNDVQKIVTRGNLALALSYTISSVGQLRRRSTASSMVVG